MRAPQGMPQGMVVTISADFGISSGIRRERPRSASSLSRVEVRLGMWSAIYWAEPAFSAFRYRCLDWFPREKGVNIISH